MKRIILINLLLLFTLGAADKKSTESILLESAKNLDKISKVFKSITDKESAQDSLDKLKKLFDETEKIKLEWSPIMEEMEEIGKNKNEEKIKEFAKLFQPVNMAYARLSVERTRLLQENVNEQLSKLLQSKKWLEGYTLYVFYH